MIEINGVLVLISENEEEFFVLEELLKTEKSIQSTCKQVALRDWTPTQHED